MPSAEQTDQNRINMLVNCFHNTPDDLVFWSFRYFLGRTSIQTHCFTRDLAKAYPYLNERIASLIRKELEEAFCEDDEMRAEKPPSPRYFPLGGDCDRASWEQVRQAYATSSENTEELNSNKPVDSTAEADKFVAGWWKTVKFRDDGEKNE